MNDEPLVEECQKLIQLSFAKIINSRQQRGGARLHKSLLVLHLLQKAKDEQRNKSYSESDLTDSFDDSSSEEFAETDCFTSTCPAASLSRSKSADALFYSRADSAFSDAENDINNYEPQSGDNRFPASPYFSYDNDASANAQVIDSHLSTWPIYAGQDAASNVNNDSDNPLGSINYCDLDFSYQNPQSFVEPQLPVGSLTSAHFFDDSSATNFVISSDLNSHGHAPASTNVVLPCANAATSMAKRKHSFETEAPPFHRVDQSGQIGADEFFETKRLRRNAFSLPMLSDANDSATSAADDPFADASENMSALICVFNTSLSTEVAAASSVVQDAPSAAVQCDKASANSGRSTPAPTFAIENSSSDAARGSSSHLLNSNAYGSTSGSMLRGQQNNFVQLDCPS